MDFFDRPIRVVFVIDVIALGDEIISRIVAPIIRGEAIAAVGDRLKLQMGDAQIFQIIDSSREPTAS